MELKRGKLHADEEKFIRDHIEKMSIREIAKYLARRPETIKKFCDLRDLTYDGMTEEDYEDAVLKAKLKDRPYWKEVEKQFDEVEKEYFAITWVRVMKQFKEDIFYSEELQLKQWITLEIMGNKIMQDRRAAIAQMDRLNDLLTPLYAINQDDRTPQEIDLIARLEVQLSMLRNAQGSYTSEHSKILEKIERIQKELKAARADRVKKIEDSASSFVGFLTLLEDEENRKRLGEELEIGRLAKDAAVKRLSKYHKFEDGQIDTPFTNASTIEDDD